MTAKEAQAGNKKQYTHNADCSAYNRFRRSSWAWDAEALIDGSMSRVEGSNRNAVEEDDILDLDPDVLDLAVRLGIVYPAAS